MAHSRGIWSGKGGGGGGGDGGGGGGGGDNGIGMLWKKASKGERRTLGSGEAGLEVGLGKSGSWGGNIKCGRRRDRGCGYGVSGKRLKIGGVGGGEGGRGDGWKIGL